MFGLLVLAFLRNNNLKSSIPTWLGLSCGREVSDENQNFALFLLGEIETLTNRGNKMEFGTKLIHGGISEDEFTGAT